MGIILEHINYKKDENIIFEDLNVSIPYNKIIGIYGDKLNDFINLLKDKEFNTGKIIDDDYYLNKVVLLDDYGNFITNNVKDELYIKLNYDNDLENEILDVLRKFDLDSDFLNRHINTLSNFENKLLHLIISMFDDNKIIIYKDLFNSVDYRNKNLFIRILKNIKKIYKKIIFIFDNDMDTINNLVDYLLIIDSNLILIDSVEDVFLDENIKNVNIEIPNFIKLKQILNNKGISVENAKNINDLLRK